MKKNNPSRENKRIWNMGACGCICHCDIGDCKDNFDHTQKPCEHCDTKPTWEEETPELKIKVLEQVIPMEERELIRLEQSISQQKHVIEKYKKEFAELIAALERKQKCQ